MSVSPKNSIKKNEPDENSVLFNIAAYEEEKQKAVVSEFEFSKPSSRKRTKNEVDIPPEYDFVYPRKDDYVSPHLTSNQRQKTKPVKIKKLKKQKTKKKVEDEIDDFEKLLINSRRLSQLLDKSNI